MKIEVFGDKKGWYWRFKNKGRITANNESFPSKGNAKRAAKAVVTAVRKEFHPATSVIFHEVEDVKTGVITITFE